MHDMRQDIATSLAQARTELHADPMVLRAHDQPDAAIGAEGGFAIAGNPIETDGEQRRALIAYREAMLVYGGAALDIAEKEAWPLARRSTMHAVLEMFTGTSDRAERRMEQDSAQLERKVESLCPQLRKAWSAQQSLAVILPAFGPYATLSKKDIDPCLG